MVSRESDRPVNLRPSTFVAFRFLDRNHQGYNSKATHIGTHIFFWVSSIHTSDSVAQGIMYYR